MAAMTRKAEQAQHDIRYVSSTVAYLDILGFRDTINRSAKSRHLVGRLYWALRNEQERQLRRRAAAAAKESRETDIAFTAFSDSLLVSYPDSTEEAIALVCRRVSAAQINLARYGLFLRGAMATGDLLSEEGDGWRIAFGPAFIAAYELENMAVWPRLLVHPGLLSQISDFKRFENEHSVYFVRESDSGLVYLDYLITSAVRRVRRALLGESRMVDPLVKLLLTHSKSISEQMINLRQSTKDDGTLLHIHTKYRLLAAYHNRTVDAICTWIEDVRPEQGLFSYGPIEFHSLSEDQLRTTRRRLEETVWAGESRRQFCERLQELRIELESP